MVGKPQAGAALLRQGPIMLDEARGFLEGLLPEKFLLLRIAGPVEGAQLARELRRIPRSVESLHQQARHGAVARRKRMVRALQRSVERHWPRVSHTRSGSLCGFSVTARRRAS